MVIGTTQATGKTGKRPPVERRGPNGVGEVAEDQQGIELAVIDRQLLDRDPPRGEPGSDPAQRPERARVSSAARICLSASGLACRCWRSRPAPPAAAAPPTMMRATPARRSAPRSASRIRRCVASLSRCVVRRVPSDVQGGAMRGSQGHRLSFWFSRTVHTVRSHLSQTPHHLIDYARRSWPVRPDTFAHRHRSILSMTATFPSQSNLCGCRCLPGEARDLPGRRASPGQGLRGGEQLHPGAAAIR